MTTGPASPSLGRCGWCTEAHPRAAMACPWPCNAPNENVQPLSFQLEPLSFLFEFDLSRAPSALPLITDKKKGKNSLYYPLALKEKEKMHHDSITIQKFTNAIPIESERD